MKTPDENPLLKEVLSDELLAKVRRASLEEPLALIKRRRRVRHTLRAASVLGLAGIGVAVLVSREPEQPEIAANHPPKMETKTEAQPEHKVRRISDEELFALFPGRAVALVGRPGQQELVFLDALRKR